MPTTRDTGPWSHVGLDINEWAQGFTNVFHILTPKTDLTP